MPEQQTRDIIKVAEQKGVGRAWQGMAGGRATNTMSSCCVERLSCLLPEVNPAVSVVASGEPNVRCHKICHDSIKSFVQNAEKTESSCAK